MSNVEKCSYLTQRHARCKMRPGADGRCRLHRGKEIWWSEADAQKYRLPKPPAQKPATGDASAEKPQEQLTCSVCYDPHGVLQFDCSHCTCVACLEKLPRRLCPVCRAELPGFSAKQDRLDEQRMRTEATERVLADRERRRAQELAEIARDPAAYLLSLPVDVRARVARRLHRWVRESGEEG